MTKFLALLRGINVGGYRPLKMEDLRGMFKILGYKNVSTYIQSGNVIFDAAEEQGDNIAQQLHRQIEETFTYDVPVFVRKISVAEEIYNHFPFEHQKGWTGYIFFAGKTIPKTD